MYTRYSKFVNMLLCLHKQNDQTKDIYVHSWRYIIQNNLYNLGRLFLVFLLCNWDKFVSEVMSHLNLVSCSDTDFNYTDGQDSINLLSKQAGSIWAPWRTFQHSNRKLVQISRNLPKSKLLHSINSGFFSPSLRHTAISLS